jgi:nonsense-mediated mRNA decay protein 3
MNELEEDPELRSQVNLYKQDNAEEILKSNKNDVENDMVENDDDFPEVELNELMDELNLEDQQQMQDS